MDAKTTYQVTAQLLDYPDNWINQDIQTSDSRILSFLTYAKNTPLEELCQLYVNTFDFSKDTTLYLTYYRYQEQKERGEALVKIKEQYTNAGLDLNKELPDYLPVMLEFASINPAGETLLEQYLLALLTLKENLCKNPYNFLIETILRQIETPKAVGDIQ